MKTQITLSIFTAVLFGALPALASERWMNGVPEPKEPRTLVYGPIHTANGVSNVYYEIDGKDFVMEGDILVDPTTPDELGVGRRLKRSRWSKGIIPYEIDPASPNADRIQAAIQHYHQYTDIRFVLRSGQRSYVRFKYNGKEGDCSSWVGRRGGKQKISVPEWCDTGSIIHEVFHALGFYHEQSRWDRNRTISVHWSNIEVKKRFNFMRVPFSKTYGVFDFDSIMLYPSFNGFAKDPKKPTMTKKDGTDFSVQREGLSKLDREALAKAYASEIRNR